jgi:hypothetical protein
MRAALFVSSLALGIAAALFACGADDRRNALVPDDAGLDASVRRDARAEAAPPPPYEDSWTRVDAGATSPVAEIDLGTVQPDTEATFDVPAGTLGFNVVVTGSGADEALGVKSIKNPNGDLVHADMTPFNGVHATSMTFVGDVASAGVPQSNHPSVMPDVQVGKWSATFSSSGPVTAKVRLQSTPDGKFHGGVVDLHVCSVAFASASSDSTRPFASSTG